MFSYLRQHWVVTALAITLLVGGGAWVALPSDAPVEEPREERVPAVELVTPGAGAAEGSAIELVGSVRSRAEANLRAEASGEVTSVLVAAGDRVRAGQVLAELDNQAQRAAVAQARAGLASAEANLAKLQAGARPEQRATLASARERAAVALAEAQTGAVNAARSAYTSAEGAVRSTADTFFVDPREDPDLIPIAGPYATREALEIERAELEEVLLAWDADVASLSPEDELAPALAHAEERTRRIISFLDRLSFIVSAQEPRADLTAAQIASQNSTLQSARASLNGALSSLSGARSGLAAARSDLTRAENALAEGVAGARAEDVAAGRAAVAQAEASLQSALASLETTLFRSPIAGTVTSLTLSPAIGSRWAP
ncbi:biotin/lipoyl-binding protein [Patescibacteria group bacterium]|jgi:multidrug efflux pump subunit AcrA (membrane-fusion protein)|nr:biotin/lipoyl-binding protein [Patescibacteria group bacterium]